MKSVVALLTALAISTAPAHAEPTRMPPHQDEAALLELTMTVLLLGYATASLVSVISSIKQRAKAKKDHGDVPLVEKCEWVPLKK
jgi:hypothetical protein